MNQREIVLCDPVRTAIGNLRRNLEATPAQIFIALWEMWIEPMKTGLTFVSVHLLGTRGAA